MFSKSLAALDTPEKFEVLDARRQGLFAVTEPPLVALRKDDGRNLEQPFLFLVKQHAFRFVGKVTSPPRSKT